MQLLSRAPGPGAARLDARAALACSLLVGAMACQSPTDSVIAPPPDVVLDTSEDVQALSCVVTVANRAVSCIPAGGATPADAGPDADPSEVFGGQGMYVQLASSGASYVGTTFSMNVTIQNLMNEAIGTPDGTTPSPDGINVFFTTPPTATGGTGTITIENPDGVGSFTATNQPYYTYAGILGRNVVSAAKAWRFDVPATVTTFTFQVYVSTDVQPLLVINEMLVNPGGTITDAAGEWFEIYNAGTRDVDMQGLAIADSAASGRRPYHIISRSLIVPAGGYVTLGPTTNTTDNGGVPIDYAYATPVSNPLTFANSLDALKISRVYGSDTLTLDRTQYSNAAVSAQNGISRELKHPALDNANLDGSNWDNALVTAVYGPGGRGTPKAQNSTFTPLVMMPTAPWSAAAATGRVGPRGATLPPLRPGLARRRAGR